MKDKGSPDGETAKQFEPTTKDEFVRTILSVQAAMVELAGALIALRQGDDEVAQKRIDSFLSANLRTMEVLAKSAGASN